MQRIEYARRQALDAYERAAECVDNASRDEWLKAAGLWEALARQYPDDYRRLYRDELRKLHDAGLLD